MVLLTSSFKHLKDVYIIIPITLPRQARRSAELPSNVFVFRRRFVLIFDVQSVHAIRHCWEVFFDSTPKTMDVKYSILFLLALHLVSHTQPNLKPEIQCIVSEPLARLPFQTYFQIIFCGLSSPHTREGIVLTRTHYSSVVTVISLFSLPKQWSVCSSKPDLYYPIIFNLYFM